MTATRDAPPATTMPGGGLDQGGSPESTSPEGAEHEALADTRVRALLQGYASLNGAILRQAGEHRLELDVPPSDRACFAGRERVRVVFSVEALQDDPDAEMAVVGSAFTDQLIAAVRSHGARLMLGVVPPDVPPDAEGARLQAPVVNGSAGDPAISLARHPVGRLTAKVTVRAGATVEEYLVDSGLFDLSTGLALDADVAARCEACSHGAAGSATIEPSPSERPTPRPVAELVTLMLGDLERRLTADITRQGDEAARALAHELARIDGYYKTLLQDSAAATRGAMPPDADARRAVEAEHARRRDEEKRRHEVRAVVYPVQMKEWEVLAQRAEWPLLSRDGHRATLVGQRILSGSGAWAIGCAHCGTCPPSALVVCYQGHAACAGCGFTCAVCDTGFCEAHGIAACHVDARPACGVHARSCASCRKPHCSAHESTCEQGAQGTHPACSACVAACGYCGAAVCEMHTVRTAATAPRGSRRLCPACVRYCEGGTSEPVGPDEVRRCASCSKVVCERHQATCAVDGQVHCSTHLRRTDRTRRLLCETHRGACAYEPEAVFAADELTECTTCHARGCATHIGVCAADNTPHCTAHLAPLLDRKGSSGCPAHRSACHVDGATFSLAGTWECPVCLKRTCASHLQPCASCGRSVCAAELERPIGKQCRTCRALQPVSDPDDRVVEASVRLRGDRPASPKSWRTARDATHTVVELDHGWTRRTVFTLRHGDLAPDGAMAHSLLGAKRL